ncbi:hypothetical protein GGR56DRAFT_629333 [Xylariaceae sp. FL0804]|nr:hypothetical protein GGR56DRAFT_629333 [Xylariaceae sp. FL0804]
MIPTYLPVFPRTHAQTWHHTGAELSWELSEAPNPPAAEGWKKAGRLLFAGRYEFASSNPTNPFQDFQVRAEWVGVPTNAQERGWMDGCRRLFFACLPLAHSFPSRNPEACLGRPRKSESGRRRKPANKKKRKQTEARMDGWMDHVCIKIRCRPRHRGRERSANFKMELAISGAGFSGDAPTAGGRDPYQPTKRAGFLLAAALSCARIRRTQYYRTWMDGKPRTVGLVGSYNIQHTGF